MPAPGEASKGAEGQRKGDGESGGEATASKEGHENVDLGVKDVNGQANGVSLNGKPSSVGNTSTSSSTIFVGRPFMGSNALLTDLENGDLPLEVSERIVKRAKELEEKRKNKKRKEANESLNKYPGLSFNPEIELRKWEVFEQQKQQMMENLEVDIEIYAEITKELEQENLDKRVEIDNLLKSISLGSSSTETYDGERAKIREDVDASRSDLKWAIQEQKRLEKEIQRANDRFREEVMDHELSKRKCARLTAEYEKKEVVYILKRNDEKLTEAKNDIESMRDKRDSSETELPFPKLVPVTENGRILEDREEMLIEELKTAKAVLDKLHFDIGSQRDARDAEAIITWNMFQKLGLRDDDIEFYRPFYDEKFQRWVDQRLWEQPTIDEVIHPGVRHAAQEISELWQESTNWLLRKHALDDHDLLAEKVAQDLEKMQQLGKMKDEDKPEIDKDIKDAKAEKAKLQEMNNMLGDFAKYLEDEAKKDEDDMVPVVVDKDDQMKTLLDKIKECDTIINELRHELPSAREEIEAYRKLLDEEDKRRGEKYEQPDEDDEDEIIKKLAKKAVMEAKPRDIKNEEEDVGKRKAVEKAEEKQKGESGKGTEVGKITAGAEEKKAVGAEEKKPAGTEEKTAGVEGKKTAGAEEKTAGVEKKTVGLEEKKTVGEEEKNKVGAEEKKIVGVEEKKTVGEEEKKTVGVEDKKTAGVEEKKTAGVEEKKTAGVEEKKTAGEEGKKTARVEDNKTAGEEVKKTAGVEEKNIAGIEEKKAAGIEEKKTAGVEEKKTAGVEEKKTAGVEEMTAGVEENKTVGLREEPKVKLDEKDKNVEEPEEKKTENKKSSGSEVKGKAEVDRKTAGEKKKAEGAQRDDVAILDVKDNENLGGKFGASVDKAVEVEKNSGEAKVAKGAKDLPASNSDPNSKILTSVDPAKPDVGAAEAQVGADASPEGKGKKKDKKKKGWFSIS